ncbi:MAG TPA: histidine kinase [Puia sp.]|jgi:two-component system LytT family sensor kinase|nr:histidine kinase [Puia sp.]
MKTVSLKRIALHIAFWLAYLTEDITLIYLWDKDKHPGISISHQLMFAALNSLSSLIPKLIFVYYVLYYNLPKLLNSKRERKKYIAQLLLALIMTTFLYRVIAVYFQSPVIYKKTVNFGPFFSIMWSLQMLADIGFVSGVAIIIKQFRLQLAGKEKEKNLIRDKLETELKFLRNQTNPHFLFNTLNNIYALARKRSDETADVVMKLSKLLRFMLYETKNEQIRISDEIKVLDDYIELEKLRYNDRLTISFIREIDNENEQIAPLLLIPFVENAFKHGASESRFESFINLEMTLDNGILEFYIENTKEQNGKKLYDENIGLTNVRRQLELLYKEHEVSIECEAAIFKVFLKINLRQYANL